MAMARWKWERTREGRCRQRRARCYWCASFHVFSSTLSEDRRSLQWSPGLDPASFHHVSQQVDFEVESLALEDVLITIYLFQFPCGCWLCHPSSGLFYDFKFSKAEGVVGQFDNCLFIQPCIVCRVSGERMYRELKMVVV